MPTLTYSASVTVAAAPEEVYALFSDVTRTGEWSPVCHEVVWDDGAVAEVGASFLGRNEVAGRTWETRNEVLVADGTTFGWSTGPGIASWTYAVTAGPEEGTAVLTESWEFSEEGQATIRVKYPERADTIIAGAPGNAEAGITATLAAMKQILEPAAV
ncbi:SRPBCC family protein [Nocardioides sp.]|uniref:SRPBCC family protein n=1 Tax=Nocardioides sp. TaxID=35761 RepID=UPI002623748B|nr:SRPBCC family protein [Nocardioides sp.]